MNHCVYWFPVIYYSPFNERLRRFETVQIVSDFGPQARLQISINHDESTEEAAREDTNLIERPITVRLYKEEPNGTTTDIFSRFTLNHVGHSRNGMVLYEFEQPDDYPTQEGPSFIKFLTHICYHHVKSLFHDHEVQSDRDSGLKAYIPPKGDHITKEAIQTNDNKPLSHYIRQYEKIFSDYAERVSIRLRTYDNIHLKFKGSVSRQDENGGVFGYEGLVGYGWKDFRRWYYDPEHKKEVETLKKDVFKWALKTSSRKRRISRDTVSYLERLVKIQNTFKDKYYYLNNLDVTNTNDKERAIQSRDIWGRMRMAESTYDRIEKRYQERKSGIAYRHEFVGLDEVLSEIEIDLGIHNPRNILFYTFFRSRYLYKQLRKIELNKAELTKETREQINKLCEGASTEYVYCKTLLESRYNFKIKKENYTKEELDDRRTALNIRNSIRYIETAKYRCSNAQTDSTHSILDKADRLSKRAEKIAIVGVVITIASLLITGVGLLSQYCGPIECTTQPNSPNECVSNLLSDDTPVGQDIDDVFGGDKLLQAVGSRG